MDRKPAIDTTSVLPDVPEMHRFPCNGRKGNRILTDMRILPGGEVYHVAGRSVNTAAHALLERVYHHEEDGVYVRPNIPDAAKVNRLLKPFERKFSKSACHSSPIPLAEYAKRSYKGRKYKVYAQAAMEVLEGKSRHSDGYLWSFIKAGKDLKFIPRIIQPRKPRFNVQVGRFLKHLEHHIYRSVDNIFGAPTVMKGYNYFQIAEHLCSAWSLYSDPVALLLDATRFDQHVSIPSLSWEHKQYLRFFTGADRRELKKLLTMQLKNHGIVFCPDGGIKYTIDGCRCTGDMNTAMGNILLMCAMIYGLLHKSKVKGSLINNGDDCVLIFEKSELKKLMQWITPYFLSLGFIMKVSDPIYQFEQILFCQTKPVYDGERWRMVRDYPHSVYKDLCTLKDIRLPHVRASYFRALGECGLNLTGGIPVVQDLYKGYCDAGKGAKIYDSLFEDIHLSWYAKGMYNLYSTPSPKAELSFWRAFGVLPDAQHAMTDYMRTINFSEVRVAPSDNLFPNILSQKFND